MHQGDTGKKGISTIQDDILGLFKKWNFLVIR